MFIYGGTARGHLAPYPGQSEKAIEQMMASKASGSGWQGRP